MDNFIDVGFLQNKCTVLVKYLYVIYLLCGAVLYEDIVRLKFRQCSIVICCISYLFCVIPQLEVLIQDTKLVHHFDAFGFFIFIQYVIATVYVVYRKRVDFRKLLDIINENSEEPIPSEIADSTSQSDYSKETNILKTCVRIFQSLILHSSAIYFGKISQKLINYETPFRVEDEESEFIIPFFCHNCNTTARYILAYNTSFFSTWFIVMFYNATLVLFFILSIYLKNRAIRLRNDIKFHSNAAFEKFEDYDQLEEQVLKRKHPSSIQLRDIEQHREFQRREFMSKVHRWILMHQRLIECVNQYQECAKTILDLLTAISVISITNMGYFSISYAADNGNFIYQFFAYLLTQFIILTILSSFGNALSDMTQIIYEAVYSTPWYHLPAKQQKVILNFLTLSQQTQTLNVFGIISLNFEFIPTMLNEVYGYIGIMRLLVMRRKN